MKNKIILSSVTLLSAFILSACGNGEKKTNKTTAAPTTEVTKETTDAPTTTTQTTTPGSSSGAKEISLADTQRIGNEKLVISISLKIGSYALLEVAKRSNIYHQTKTMR